METPQENLEDGEMCRDYETEISNLKSNHVTASRQREHALTSSSGHEGVHYCKMLLDQVLAKPRAL